MTPDELNLFERFTAANLADAARDDAAHPGYMTAELIAAAVPRVVVAIGKPAPDLGTLTNQEVV